MKILVNKKLDIRCVIHFIQNLICIVLAMKFHFVGLSGITSKNQLISPEMKIHKKISD